MQYFRTFLGFTAFGSFPERQVNSVQQAIVWVLGLRWSRTFGYVEIEEIAVKDCLDDACNDGDHVEEAFEVEAPDPVEEIQGTIEAQEEQVVGGDGLCFPSLTDHEELRKDGHRLQVDGESPQDLQQKSRTTSALRTPKLGFKRRFSTSC